jgi:hypothetical protein
VAHYSRLHRGWLIIEFLSVQSVRDMYANRISFIARKNRLVRGILAEERNLIGRVANLSFFSTPPKIHKQNAREQRQKFRIGQLRFLRPYREENLALYLGMSKWHTSASGESDDDANFWTFTSQSQPAGNSWPPARPGKWRAYTSNKRCR